MLPIDRGSDGFSGSAWQVGPWGRADRVVLPPPLRPALHLDEARRALRAGLSVLLIGVPYSAAEVLEQLAPELSTPVLRFGSGERLPAVYPVPSIFIDAVDTLHHAEQHALLEWTGRFGARTRIAAIARRPLYPLVRCGAFLEPLYYRLNAATFDFAGHGVAPFFDDVEPATLLIT